MQKRHLFVLLHSLLITAAGSAQCVNPSAAKQAEISNYVMKKYQMTSSSGLLLAGPPKQEEGCYWKFHYTASAQARDITLYLSPDGEHLAPAVYDIRQDPLLEEKQKNQDTLKLLIAGSPSAMGQITAPVTIVEFSDFQCPYCKRLTDALEKEVLPKEGGRVKLVFRSFPLPMHPWAKEAAVVAQCAGLQKQEAFWAMHDYFFQNQTSIRADSVKEQAMQFASTVPGLDHAQMQACVDRDLGLGPVMQDQELGHTMGVHATPTFFVNGVRFDGAYSAPEIEALIEKAAGGTLVSAPDRISVQGPTINVATGPTSRANQCAPTAR